MDQIWAPWRMEYVRRADKEADCFLCEAARSAQDRERLVLWRGPHCLAVINRWPYNNGHVMVAPLSHTADFNALSDAEMLAQFQMLQRCKRNLDMVLHPAGFNVGLNLGKAAGAGVSGHMHWHIVPRWEGDTNFMSVLADTRVVAQSLEALWGLLRDADSQEVTHGKEGGRC